MRTRLSEYKATLSSGSLAVHIKQPSNIVLEHDLAASIDVYNENADETYSMTYDNGDSAWKIAGSDTLYYISGDINNPQVGDSVFYVVEEEPVLFGSITAVHAAQQGYTDAAKRTITEATRLIYDETQKVLLCSTAKKANIYGIEPSSETGYDIAISFNLTALAAEATAAGKTAKATAIGNIAATDMFTIAFDWGTSAEDIIDALGDMSDLAQEAQVKDGNDTAISVAKDIRSEVGTGSDTAAETGTLFAVLKWVKDKVKAVYNALTDGTNGLAAIKQAVAAIVIPTNYAKETTAQQAATYAQAAATYAEAAKTAILANTYLNSDVNAGKAAIAAEISLKGVPTEATSSLSAIAQNVRAISQQPIIMNDGDLAHMYSKQLYGVPSNDITPGYWNLYEVMAQLLNDGRLLNYGGIVLVDFFKNSASTALTGADTGGAYVVSDIDGNGNYVMYTESLTHDWHDDNNGKANRWIAYCFASAEHSYALGSGNVRNVHIGRDVGSISFSAALKIRRIIATDGNQFSGIVYNSSYVPEYDRHVVIRNIKTISSNIFPSYHAANTGIETAYIKVQNLNGGIFASGSGTVNTYLTSVVVEAENIGYGAICQGFSGEYRQLAYIGISGVESCTHYMSIQFNGAGNTPNNGTFAALKCVCCDNIEQLTLNLGDSLTAGNLRYVYIGHKIGVNDKERSVTISAKSAIPITDIEIKEGWCKPLNISTCTNVTEENIYVHILQRIKQDEVDCGDGVTITLGTTNMNKLAAHADWETVYKPKFIELTGTYGYQFPDMPSLT